MAEHKGAHPVHVTLRARARFPSLRGKRVLPVVRAAIQASGSVAFRVLQFSVQEDHIHFFVKAPDKRALSSGARGLSIRIARAINRKLGRAGPVWGDRYQARALRTPEELRAAKRGLIGLEESPKPLPRL